jgi:hypothetical protein
MSGNPDGEPREVSMVWQRLQDHRTDPKTGDCPLCLVSGPCAIANAAVQLLAEQGLSIVEQQPVEQQPCVADRRLARLTVIARFRRQATRRHGSR